MIRQVALLKCSYFRLLSVRRGGILTSETVKIVIDLLCALWTIIIPALAAFVNSISLFLYRISNKKPMAFAIGFVFSMQKHRKTRNVPFPRPCGATGNDAQKLHAPAFAHFRGAVLTHEVLCCIWPIPSQGSIRASSISSSSAFPVSRKPRPWYRRIAGIFSGAQVITTFCESPNGFPVI